MDYNYVSSGQVIDIYGCADYKLVYFYTVKFAVNSIAYDLRQARKGILEKIAIKSIRILDGAPIGLYQDSYNALHNESDLGTYDEALAIARAYIDGLYGQESPC